MSTVTSFVEPVDGALDGLEAFPHARARLSRRAAADRTGAGEMMVDLAAHHQSLAADGVDQVRRARGRGVGDDRQRGLQRMGEVAGMPPRLLGLRFAVREQLVDLFGQRPDFGREILADAGLLARPDGGHFATHAAQRPQPIEGLQGGEDEKADAQCGEAPDQGLPQAMNLLVDGLARLRDLESPADLRSGQDRIPLRDPQRLGVIRDREFVAVVEVRLDVGVGRDDAQPAIP